MKIFLSFLALIVSAGCVEMMSNAMTTKTTTTKVEEPFTIQATRNYLPRDVNIQPAYTIYEGTKWECKYRIDNGDYACCNVEQFSSASPWKYCLIVDADYKAYGFIELGVDKYIKWSEGKQPIFRRVSK